MVLFDPNVPMTHNFLDGGVKFWFWFLFFCFLMMMVSFSMTSLLLLYSKFTFVIHFVVAATGIFLLPTTLDSKADKGLGSHVFVRPNKLLVIVRE